MTTLLTVERNGRKFIVDWKTERMNMPSFIVKEITIGDCCFLLIFSSSTKTFALNLSKKPAAESTALLQLSIFNLEPHEVTVSKDDTHLQVMPKTSVNEWGRVSWDLTRRRSNRNHYEDAWYSDSILSAKVFVHFRLVLDYVLNQSSSGLKGGVLSHLAQLINSGTGSDVDFVVKGERIFGHTFILRGGISPVFTAMFEHDMTESSSRTVVVEDIEPNIFRQLLRFLYTGDAPEMKDENMAELLFIAADKYQVEKLKDLCIPVLSKAIDDENVLHFLVLSHLHSAVWLQEDCIDFIVRKKHEFINGENFSVLSENYPDLFSGISQRMNN